MVKQFYCIILISTFLYFLFGCSIPDAQTGIDDKIINGISRDLQTDRGDHISAGQTLKLNDYLQSEKNKYVLSVQNDKNMVIYRTDTWKAIWASGTWKYSITGFKLEANGNLIAYESVPVYSLVARLVWVDNNDPNNWFSKPSLNSHPETRYFNELTGFTTKIHWQSNSKGTDDGKYVMYMQDDGNLVTYRTDTWKAVWCSGSWEPY